jgi:hypothetical protein
MQALSPIIQRFVKQRRFFDPKKKEDLNELSYFLKHTKWKNGCPFFIEWPYENIVAMCQEKYTKYMLTK